MEKELSSLEFEEKQYIGYNKFSISSRIVIAIFCFLVYFFSDEYEIPINIPQQVAPENLFFGLGIFILVISLILLFVLHLHTKITNGSLILDGLWTARRVKIDLSTIKSAKKRKYSKYVLNRPLYNLHLKGRIKFFTHGNEAVELVDKDGQKYLIGTQHPLEFIRVLESRGIAIEK